MKWIFQSPLSKFKLFSLILYSRFMDILCNPMHYQHDLRRRRTRSSLFFYFFFGMSVKRWTWIWKRVSSKLRRRKIKEGGNECCAMYIINTKLFIILYKTNIKHFHSTTQQPLTLALKQLFGTNSDKHGGNFGFILFTFCPSANNSGHYPFYLHSG